MRTIALVAICIGGIGLVACGSSGSDGAASNNGGAAPGLTTAPGALPSGGGGGGSVGDPRGKIRVVNLFLRDDKPYGPIDLYDVIAPSADDTPLIAGLAYGQVSDYVSPKALGPTGTLYLYPAGSVERDQDGFGGQGISNNGWEQGDQSTVVIGAAKGLTESDPTIPFYQEISESDTSQTWKPIAGKGAILANASGAGVDSLAASVTLVVDGTCPMRVDPENSPTQGQGIDSIANGNAVTYAVEPGSHEVGLLATDPTTGLTACTGDAAEATTSVDVAAGSRVEVFVFGSTKSNLNILIAPVDEL